MTERQLQRLLENRPRYEVVPLVDQAFLQGLLRASARACRRRQAAEDAWRRVAPAGLVPSTTVEAFDCGVLLVRVQEPAVASELRLLRAVMERRLAGLVPGLRELRVLTGPAVAQDEA